MTDRDLVVRKLAAITDHIGRVRRRRGEDLDVFQGDLDRQDAAGMSLLVAVQEALDVALHVASDEGWGVPSSYAEAFRGLAQHGVVSAALAADLVRLAALRKRLAHGYATVDAARIWNELPAGMDALDAFVSAVAAWIGGG